MSLLDIIEDHARSEADWEGRYFGFLIGKITNITDPDNQGRVKAKFGAMGDNEESDWLRPLWPGSIEAVPNKDDLVIVGFIDGDPSQGFYGCYANSNTQNRPKEAMVLGSTFMGMFNYLVTQFNQLRSDMASHTHAAGTLSCPNDGLGPVTISGGTAAKATTAVAANKGKAADGSEPSESSSKTVLSGKAKVR